MEKISNVNKSDNSSIALKISQKFIFNLFKKFKRGNLTLIMPNSEHFNFGETDEISATINIHNLIFFKKIILSGDIGFGESYSDGDWSTPDLVSVIKWAILNIENVGIMSGAQSKTKSINLIGFLNKIGHAFNRNTLSGSHKNISLHYDLSNEFYKLMLDSTMSYSCGIFKNSKTTLLEAQNEKLKTLCEDLELKASDHILEIGCGWGGFAEYAAKNYGCKVTGITISNQQLEFAKSRIKEANLDHLVTIEFADYRTFNGSFDKIVSIEMIEAVGDEFLPLYFSQCERLLKPHGLFVLQAITSPDSRYKEFKNSVDWIQKHIFPGSLLPSIAIMTSILAKNGSLQIYNLRDIGSHYAKTLNKWDQSFNSNISKIKNLGFDEEFIKKWKYYLNYCEAAFSMKNISVVQITFTRPNNFLSHK